MDRTHTRLPFSRAALLSLATLLAACAGIASSAERLRDASEAIEVGRFSQAMAGSVLPENWLPYIILPSKPLTRYALVETGETVSLEANAEASASGLHRSIRINPARHPIVTWRWRIGGLISGADVRRADAEDSPARLVLFFHGDPGSLDLAVRARMRIARALSGREIPFATLMYVVSNDLPVGTLVSNPHSDRIQMLVVASGKSQEGRWIDFRRNVFEDYRRAFGKDPADIVSVGVMTDADNTGRTARCHYGDISFLRQ